MDGPCNGSSTNERQSSSFHTSEARGGVSIRRGVKNQVEVGPLRRDRLEIETLELERDSPNLATSLACSKGELLK